MTEDILIPTNPDWDEYIERLIIHARIRENPEHPDYYISDCDGSFRVTRNILTNRFPEMNIKKTLEYLRKMEWYCDCDVFFGCPNGLGKSPFGVDIK